MPCATVTFFDSKDRSFCDLSNDTTCNDLQPAIAAGVSRPVLSLTKPQDETKTRQTSFVSDCLETVSVLFFLFSGDTGTNPLQDHTPRVEREESEDVERLLAKACHMTTRDEKNLRLVNKSDLSLSPFDFITHNCPSMSKEGSACKDNAIKNGR
ncbi:hypothetical protein PROFUN_16609 [Planoprotostelium fungivorum]|uniref:Uncharacterized protein n=1 Tax=Planoprotostelium fungivorum TaxID=1890364 RepID=A0A2P6MPU7_9EUKA|nr:hypothetical protein PROFUN_16609 [Planoprotostelium fungivorum]